MLPAAVFQHPGGDAPDDRVGRHVARYHGARAHHASATKGDPRQDRYAAADPAIIADDDGPDGSVALLAHGDIGAVKAVHRRVDKAVRPHHPVVSNAGLLPYRCPDANAGMIAQRHAAPKARMPFYTDVLAAGGQHMPRAEGAEASGPKAEAAVGAWRADGKHVGNDDCERTDWLQRIPPFFLGDEKARPHISAGAGEKNSLAVPPCLKAQRPPLVPALYRSPRAPVDGWCPARRIHPPLSAGAAVS